MQRKARLGGGRLAFAVGRLENTCIRFRARLDGGLQLTLPDHLCGGRLTFVVGLVVDMSDEAFQGEACQGEAFQDEAVQGVDPIAIIMFGRDPET